MTVETWYAAGLEHHADELETAARLTRLRAKRLPEIYRGEALTVFSEGMSAAAKELRKAATQLRPTVVIDRRALSRLASVENSEELA
jgi:hypothetical protein